MPSPVSKVRYSPTEQRILALLPEDGTKLSSDEIIDLHYGKRKRPFNARQTVIGALRTLIRKSVKNREPFRICKSERKGPHPMKFWIERKNEITRRDNRKG